MEVYLQSMTFPDGEEEFVFFNKQKLTCYDSHYPFQVLSRHHLTRLDFAPVTILYGGNGSGKTTALNCIAEKLHLHREAPYNRSKFLEDYLARCRVELTGDRPIPKGSCILTSDDVFERMLELRSLNDGLESRREVLMDEFMDAKYAQFQFQSMEDYDRLHQIIEARRQTESQYVRRRMMDEPREYSNGENAFRYFVQKIGENGLFLLDEPENSLSPARQMELAQFLEEAVRFYGCQLVIATHTPFLLAMKEARIYDLDADPAEVKPWYDLPNVRAYYDFFQAHRDAFES